MIVTSFVFLLKKITNSVRFIIKIILEKQIWGMYNIIQASEREGKSTDLLKKGEARKFIYL